MDLHQQVFRIPEGILLSLGLSWNFFGKCPADLDLAAVSFGKNGKFLDVVFFNHTMAGTSDAETELLRQEFVLNLKDMPYMFLSGDSRTGGEAENRVISWEEMQRNPHGGTPSSLFSPHRCSHGEDNSKKKGGVKQGRKSVTSSRSIAQAPDSLVHYEQEEFARSTGGNNLQRFKANTHSFHHTFCHQEEKLDAEFAAGDGRLQYLLQGPYTEPFSLRGNPRGCPFRRYPAPISDESIVFHLSKIPSQAQYIFICATSYTGTDFSRLSEVRLDVFEEILLSSEEEDALTEGGGKILAGSRGRGGRMLPKRRRRLGMINLKSSTGNGTANLCACLVRTPPPSKGDGGVCPYSTLNGGGNSKSSHSSSNNNCSGGVGDAPSFSFPCASFPTTDRSTDLLVSTTLHSSVSPSFLLALEDRRRCAMTPSMWDLREVNVRAMGYTFVDILPAMLHMMNVPRRLHEEALRAVPNYSLRKTPRTSLPLLPPMAAEAADCFSSRFLSSPSSAQEREGASYRGAGGSTSIEEHLRQQLADLRFGLGWDGNVDLDAFCIVLDKTNKYLTHFHPKCCSTLCRGSTAVSCATPTWEMRNEKWECYPCRHSGDCTTGVGYAGDMESIDLLVHLLPPEAHVLVLGATLVSSAAQQERKDPSTSTWSLLPMNSIPTVAGMPISSPLQHPSRGSEGGLAVHSIMEVPGLYLRLQNRPLHYPYAEEVDRWDVFRDVSLASCSSCSHSNGKTSCASHGISHSAPFSTPVGRAIEAEEKVLAPRRVEYAKDIRAHTLLFGALWKCSADFSPPFPSCSSTGTIAPGTTSRHGVSGGGPPDGSGRGTSGETSPQPPLFSSSSQPPSTISLRGSRTQNLQEDEITARRRLLNKTSSYLSSNYPLSLAVGAAAAPTRSFTSTSQTFTEGATTGMNGEEKLSSSFFTYFPLRQVIPVEETLSFPAVISYTESLFMLVRHLQWLKVNPPVNEKRRTLTPEGNRRHKKRGSTARSSGYRCRQSSGGCNSFIPAEDTSYPPSTPLEHFRGPSSGIPASMAHIIDTSASASAGGLSSSSFPSPSPPSSTLPADKVTSITVGRSSSSRLPPPSSLPSVWSLTEAVSAVGWGGGCMITGAESALSSFHEAGGGGGGSRTRASVARGDVDRSHPKHSSNLLADHHDNDHHRHRSAVPRPMFSSYSNYACPFGILFQFVEVMTLAPHLPGDTHCIGEVWVCGAGPERSPLTALASTKKWKKQTKFFTGSRCSGKGIGSKKNMKTLGAFHGEKGGNWMNTVFRTSFLMGEHSPFSPSVQPYRAVAENNESEHKADNRGEAEGARVDLSSSSGIPVSSLSLGLSSSGGQVAASSLSSVSAGIACGSSRQEDSLFQDQNSFSPNGGKEEISRKDPVSYTNGRNTSSCSSSSFSPTSSSPISAPCRRSIKTLGSDRLFFLVFPFDRIRIVVYSKGAFGTGEIDLYSLQSLLFNNQMGCGAGCECYDYPIGAFSSTVVDAPTFSVRRSGGGGGEDVLGNSASTNREGRGNASILLSLPLGNVRGDRGREEGEEELHPEKQPQQPYARRISKSTLEMVLQLHTPGEGGVCVPTHRCALPTEVAEQKTHPPRHALFPLPEDDRKDGGNSSTETAGFSLPNIPVNAVTHAVVKVRLSRIRLEECEKILKGQLKEAKQSCASHRVEQENKANAKQRKLFKWFS